MPLEFTTDTPILPCNKHLIQNLLRGVQLMQGRQSQWRTMHTLQHLQEDMDIDRVC